MSGIKKVVVLIGSSRGIRTTSASISDYLGKKFEDNGIENYKKFRAYQLEKNAEQFGAFMNALNDSDLFIICAPLYVDALPSSAVHVLEMLDGEGSRDFLQEKCLAAVIHSGYPEPQQREVAFDICRCFAGQMDMKWLGGIGFGMTSIINGASLTEMGKMTKWMRSALDKCADSLSRENYIPEEAVKMSDKRLVPLPVRVLKILVNMRTRKSAKK